MQTKENSANTAGLPAPDNCPQTVTEITTADELLIEDGVLTGVRAGHKTYKADRVIVATGGASYPQTGSTGDGYRFARQAGHTVVPANPSLVPLFRLLS